MSGPTRSLQGSVRPPAGCVLLPTRTLLMPGDLTLHPTRQVWEKMEGLEKVPQRVWITPKARPNNNLSDAPKNGGKAP